MNEKQQKDEIVADIKDLREKLLSETTRKIKNPEIATGEDGKKRNISEIEKIQKVRQLRNRLKEMVGIYGLIIEAEEIIKRK